MNTPAPESGERADSSVAVSIIVPTYGEAENLRLLIPQVCEAMAPTGTTFEIVVVDDACGDDTPDVMAEHAAAGLPARLITRVDERGLSSAVIRGFREAEGEMLICMDADLSHPPEAVPRVVAALGEEGVDFVIGSRYVPGGSTDESWGLFRWLNSKVATLMARPFTKAKDPMAGFFALRNERFRNADRLSPVGYKIGLELIVKCHCKTIREVPIYFADRQIGESKLSFKEQLNYIKHVKRLADYKYGAFSQFMQFCFVGATGTVVDLGSLMILMATSLTLEPARAIAILIGMTWNFALNRRLTFSYSRTGNIVTQYIRFVLSCTVGAVVNWVITMSLAVWGSKPLEQHVLIASFIGILVGLVFNYVFSRFWVFKRPDVKKDEAAEPADTTEE
jgi:dolichol-phosphate mannosyltransferase